MTLRTTTIAGLALAALFTLTTGCEKVSRRRRAANPSGSSASETPKVITEVTTPDDSDIDETLDDLGLEGDGPSASDDLDLTGLSGGGADPLLDDGDDPVSTVPTGGEGGLED